MAFQSVWYYTDFPEKVIDLIEEDIAKNLTVTWETLNYMEMLNKEKETHKMRGFQLLIVGGFYGIIFKEQIGKIFCMI